MAPRNILQSAWLCRWSVAYETQKTTEDPVVPAYRNKDPGLHSTTRPLDVYSPAWPSDTIHELWQLNETLAEVRRDKNCKLCTAEQQESCAAYTPLNTLTRYVARLTHFEHSLRDRRPSQDVTRSTKGQDEVCAKTHGCQGYGATLWRKRICTKARRECCCCKAKSQGCVTRRTCRRGRYITPQTHGPF